MISIIKLESSGVDFFVFLHLKFFKEKDLKFLR